MQLQSENKTPLKTELKAGVHLVSIHSLKKHLDENKQPVIKDGELRILITFVTGTNPNLYHEQIYWLGKGVEGKEKYFTKMCIDAGIDMSKTPLLEKDAKGKRLWIGIREVFTLIKNGEEVLKDILDKPVVEHFIFNTSPIFDVEKPPTWKGDPAKNNGEAADDFVGYKEAHESGYDTVISEGSSAAVLEILPVTMENALSEVEIEKELDKVSDGMEVKSVFKQSFEDQNVYGIAGIKIEAEKIENIAPAKARELLNDQNIPTPNFGEQIVNIPDMKVTELAKPQIPAMPNFNEKMGEMEVSTSSEQPKQTTLSSPMPNFGDTPDTKF